MRVSRCHVKESLRPSDSRAGWRARARWRSGWWRSQWRCRRRPWACCRRWRRGECHPSCQQAVRGWGIPPELVGHSKGYKQVGNLTWPQNGVIFATLLFSSSFGASRRAGSRDMLQSARRLDFTGDFGRALIRKITWAAP